jgi:hypothetical protein
VPDPVARQSPEAVIKGLKSRWKAVSSGAVWVLSVLVLFLDSLPAAHPGADMMVRFPQFLIAIAFGLFLIAANKWTVEQHLGAWVAVCALSLAAGTAIFLRYVDLRAQSTEMLDETRYVIGELRTDPDGLEMQAACAATNQGHLCDTHTLLDFCHGKLSEIWTPASISRVQRTAAMLYIGAAVFFMVAMVSMLNALRWAPPEGKDATKGKAKEAQEEEEEEEEAEEE